MLEINIYCNDQIIDNALKKFIKSISPKVKIIVVRDILKLSIKNDVIVFYIVNSLEIDKFNKFFSKINIPSNDSRFLFIFKKKLPINKILSLKLNTEQILFYPSNRKNEVSNKIRNFILINKLNFENRFLNNKFLNMKFFLEKNFSINAIRKLVKNSNKNNLHQEGEFTIIYFKINEFEKLFDSFSLKELFKVISDIQTEIIDLTSKYNTTVLNLIEERTILLLGYPILKKENQINNALKFAFDIETIMSNINTYNPYKLKKKLTFSLVVFTDHFYIGRTGSIKHNQFSVLGRKMSEILFNLKVPKLNNSYHNFIFNANFKEKLIKLKIFKNANRIIDFSSEIKNKDMKKYYAILKNNSMDE